MWMILPGVYKSWYDLPPKILCEGRKNFSPEQLAIYLNQLISEPEEYLKYFWWKPHFQVYPQGKVSAVIA